jgi:hypothetical protein
MKNIKIVYKEKDGSAVVLHPNLNSGLTLKQIADKDVPAGVPYVFLDESLIPKDVTFINAWSIEEIKNPDGIGANYGVGSSKEVIGWNANGSPILRG